MACLDSSPETYAKIRALAEKHPNIVICLDHAGFPRQRDDEYFGSWRKEIQDLAVASNVIIKISGLGMYDRAWTVETLRPWVMTCIESFGPQRTVFGSNWPVDRMYSSYPDVINAYAELINRFSANEQTAMFSGNAERYFRI